VNERARQADRNIGKLFTASLNGSLLAAGRRDGQDLSALRALGSLNPGAIASPDCRTRTENSDSKLTKRKAKENWNPRSRKHVVNLENLKIALV